MLTCYISARARRRIATDIAETATASDSLTATRAIAAIVDEPATASAITDTHFGEPIIEAANAADTIRTINAWDTIEMWPQGRLTLQSATPVQTADQTAKTTIYFDSYVGELVPVWNGTVWQSLVITGDEISMGLDAGVPRVASGSLYDIFGVSSGGLLALAIGPAWSSTTSRGTGAGTTELQRKNGIWTNKNSLTNAYGGASGTTNYGPISANQATYLGTLYATANGQTGIALKPAAAAGGSNTIVGLFNAYNRVRVSAHSQDNTSSWTYSSNTTWRAANANNSNRVTFIDGLQVSAIEGIYALLVQASTSNPVIGMNLNSTSATPAATGQSNTIGEMTVADHWPPQLGLNYIQAMEIVTSAAAATFFGAQTSPTRQVQTLTVNLDI